MVKEAVSSSSRDSSLKKRRKTGSSTEADNEGDLYKKVITFEEQEAFKRSPDLDTKLYCEICKDIRNLLEEIYDIKSLKTADAIAKTSEKTLQAAALVVTLKKLNRLEKVRSTAARDALNTEKQKVDSINLQYQNLMYEAAHLLSEYKKCKQFKSKDEDIQLINIEEFLKEAPADKTKPFKNVSELNDSQKHELHLARLEWELTQRKKLAELCNTFEEEKKQIAAACLGPISIGVSFAWTSPILPQLQHSNSTILPHLTNEEGSWIGSMLTLGALTAALPAEFLSNFFGRKKCVLYLVLPYIISTILFISTENVYDIGVGRFLSGVTTGGTFVVASMYISDIAEPSFRGTLWSFFQLLIYVGIVKTAILGAYYSYLILTTISGGITLVLGIFFWFLPESPSYLIKFKKRAAADIALQFYRDSNFNIAEALDEIDHENEKHSKNKQTIIQALKSKTAVRCLVACVGLMLFQQLSGFAPIVFYNVQIFQKAGADFEAYTLSIIVSVIQLLSGILHVLIIEKFRRRTFLYVSAIGAFIGLVLLAIYFHLQICNINFSGIRTMPLISLIIYNIAFAMGLGPIPWIVNDELFGPVGPQIKAVSNGISLSITWICMFIITKTFPIMLDNVAFRFTFYMYAGFMVLCVIFIKCCVPETKGKTPQQIEEELNL